MFTAFKSIGHFFAVVVQQIIANLPKAEAVATQAIAAAPGVEAITSQIPVYGPLAVTAEQAGVALLGEVLALLHTGGDAAAANLVNVGLDVKVIQTAQAVYHSIPTLVTSLASAQVKK